MKSVFKGLMQDIHIYLLT